MLQPVRFDLHGTGGRIQAEHHVADQHLGIIVTR